MTSGTIFMKGANSCEVLVFPETGEHINQVRTEVRDHGLEVRAAEIVGNFAVEFTNPQDLVSLQGIVHGQVIG